jgi:hypothetical protein
LLNADAIGIGCLGTGRNRLVQRGLRAATFQKGDRVEFKEFLEEGKIVGLWMRGFYIESEVRNEE